MERDPFYVDELVRKVKRLIDTTDAYEYTPDRQLRCRYCRSYAFTHEDHCAYQNVKLALRDLEGWNAHL